VTGLLVLLALFAFCGWLYFSRRSATGLPAGLLVYDDAGRQHLQGPLVSHRLLLAGRPDYLIQTPQGLVPVELKSGACPRSGPHAARVAQLMTYCVLVEDMLARPVPYGFLEYSDSRRKIPFTADRKREVLQLAEEIRRKRAANVHRQHQHIGRRPKCGYRSVCEEALS
jgi:CRISPR/Cas system-associated exonuclease Cas4 (RecB family)